MAGVTYKCPSCGAYLKFDPDQQRWGCDFCGATFEEKELLQKAAEFQKQAEAENAEKQRQETGAGEQVIYHCPSCGSEIMTDETTVATNCYYCHNPVVLQGKLTAGMKPDKVLPFTIGKEKATERFMQWVQKKRFVPGNFFSKERIASMAGVYYPHFVTECTMDGQFSGEGRNVSVAETQKYIITTTQHYAVRRRADITFRGVMRPALKSTDRKLSDGIHPFPLENLEPFSSAYLSGFLAERRDLEAKEVQPDVEQELEDYLEPLLTTDMSYSSYSGSASGKVKDMNTEYVLLPTWVLTYPGKDPKEPYYYVMNGSTGEVCGKLPVDNGKLLGFGALLGLGIFVVLCLLSYFLF